MAVEGICQKQLDGTWQKVCAPGGGGGRISHPAFCGSGLSVPLQWVECEYPFPLCVCQPGGTYLMSMSQTGRDKAFRPLQHLQQPHVNHHGWSSLA
jgi:hypothetical protein